MDDNRINYTQVIWEITCLLQEADSLEAALRTSLESVVKAVGAEAGTVWFYNSKGDKRIYPSFWIGGADLTGLSLECGEGIAGTVVKDAKTTVVKDCQQDARWAGRFDKATGFVTRSMICVALTNKYETIGCIQIINKTDGSLYTDDDVFLCENLAMLTAIAIDNKGLSLGFTEEKKALISLRDASLTDAADGTTQIFKDVTFDLLEGEFLVILGESGCGKSELFNVVGGLDKLSGGSLGFDGKDLTEADDAALCEYRRNQIGFVFSQSGLVPSLNVAENIEFARELCKKPADTASMLELVGLTEKKDAYPDELTEAQCRRAAIARALVKKPRVVLADEPVAGLNYSSAIEILGLFEKMVGSGTTVLMVTHNEEIAKMANRVIRMKGATLSDVTVNSRPAAAKELVW